MPKRQKHLTKFPLIVFCILYFVRYAGLFEIFIEFPGKLNLCFRSRRQREKEKDLNLRYGWVDKRQDSRVKLSVHEQIVQKLPLCGGKVYGWIPRNGCARVCLLSATSSQPISLDTARCAATLNTVDYLKELKNEIREYSRGRRTFKRQSRISSTCKLVEEIENFSSCFLSLQFSSLLTRMLYFANYSNNAITRKAKILFLSEFFLASSLLLTFTMWQTCIHRYPYIEYDEYFCFRFKKNKIDYFNIVSHRFVQ